MKRHNSTSQFFFPSEDSLLVEVLSVSYIQVGQKIRHNWKADAVNYVLSRPVIWSGFYIKYPLTS